MTYFNIGGGLVWHRGAHETLHELPQHWPAEGRHGAGQELHLRAQDSVITRITG